MTPLEIQELLGRIAPRGTWCSLRWVETHSENLTVRDDMLLPPSATSDRGAMITVVTGEGQGIAATSDLSVGGLYQAARVALDWAQAVDHRGVVDFSKAPLIISCIAIIIALIVFPLIVSYKAEKKSKQSEWEKIRDFGNKINKKTRDKAN